MRNENLSRIVERANRELDLLDHRMPHAEQLQYLQVQALYLGVVLVGTIAAAVLTLYENRF